MSVLCGLEVKEVVICENWDCGEGPEIVLIYG